MILDMIIREIIRGKIKLLERPLTFEQQNHDDKTPSGTMDRNILGEEGRVYYGGLGKLIGNKTPVGGIRRS